MGIRTVNLEAGSVLRSLVQMPLVYRPSDTNTIFATQPTGGDDPTTLNVGDDILIAAPNPQPVPNCGITLWYNDAAGTDASCSVLVTGFNQFGEPVTETLSHSAGGAAYTQSTLAYSSISSIVVTAIAAAAAADSLAVGFDVTDSANRLRLGMPFKCKGLHEIIGPYLMQIVAPSGLGASVGTNLLIENFDPVTQTFDVAYNGSTGLVCVMQLHPSVGIDTR